MRKIQLNLVFTYKSITFAQNNNKRSHNAASEIIMDTISLKPNTINMIDALWAVIQAQPKKVKEALSIRLAEDNVSAKNMITPAVAKQIRKARQEYSKGETISCQTPEEMQQYFDSL